MNLLCNQWFAGKNRKGPSLVPDWGPIFGKDDSLAGLGVDGHSVWNILIVVFVD
jgi:hypothetical protein